MRQSLPNIFQTSSFIKEVGYGEVSVSKAGYDFTPRSA